MRKILALALCLLTMLVPLAARAEAAPETALGLAAGRRDVSGRGTRGLGTRAFLPNG